MAHVPRVSTRVPSARFAGPDVATATDWVAALAEAMPEGLVLLTSPLLRRWTGSSTARIADEADRQEPSEELAAKAEHLKEKVVKLEGEMQRLAAMEKMKLASPDQQI